MGAVGGYGEPPHDRGEPPAQSGDELDHPGAPRRTRLAWHPWRWVGAGLILAAAAVLALGFGFRGSAERIPVGVTVAGVDVSGLTASEAVAALTQRAAAVVKEPVLLVVQGKGVELTRAEAGLAVDWEHAVERALAVGQGLGPLQGFKRLGVRFSGRDVTPPAEFHNKVVRERLDLLSAHLDEPAHDPQVRLNGVEVVAEPGRAGDLIPRERAIALVRDALVEPHTTGIELPVERVEPDMAALQFARTAELLEKAVSAPVTIGLGDSTFDVSPDRIAPLLRARGNGRGGLAISGAEAKAFFRELAQAVKRDAVDARFEITGSGQVTVVGHSNGRKLDLAASAEALLAALTGEERVANLAVKEVEPELTTERAEAMGIVDVVGTYTTGYGGEAGRKANVRLVSRLVDDHLIAPGEVFSFNDTTGERNASKGFVEAPVIIDGEVQTALGGGVCQVSTTVYNAAYEAGLGIELRVNHSLYLDYYPTGRDATVDFPNIDMQFRNDTENWLLLRVSVGDSEVSVTLYGTPVERRVVTKTTKLRATDAPTIERVDDRHLVRGETEVEKHGAPAREVSVRRVVYAADGDLLYDDRWDSQYLAEKRVVRVGTAEPTAPAPVEPAPVSPELAPAPVEPVPVEPSAEPAAPPEEVAPPAEAPVEEPAPAELASS